MGASRPRGAHRNSMATRAARRRIGTRLMFPNVTMHLHRNGNQQGTTNQLVLRTAPQWGKLDVKNFLEQVYGIKAAKVNSLNVEGKKKWKPGRLGVIRRKSYKKFYVRLARGSVLQ